MCLQKINWIIEKGLYAEPEQDLIDAIKNQGHGLRELEYIPFQGAEFDFSDIEDRPCVFHGSLNFMRQLRKQYPKLYPGVRETNGIQMGHV